MRAESRGVGGPKCIGRTRTIMSDLAANRYEEELAAGRRAWAAAREQERSAAVVEGSRSSAFASLQRGRPAGDEARAVQRLASAAAELVDPRTGRVPSAGHRAIHERAAAMNLSAPVADRVLAGVESAHAARPGRRRENRRLWAIVAAVLLLGVTQAAILWAWVRLLG